MKYIKQFLIILTVTFLAEVMKWILPFAIAPSIYGIVLMFLALQFKIIKVSDIKETSAFLIEIMPIMFVPAAVGLINSWDIIQVNVVTYLIMIVVTTILVMVVSGKVTQILLKEKDNA